MNFQPFNPVAGGGTGPVATGVAAVPIVVASQPKQLLITNPFTAVQYVRVNNTAGGPAATTADTPVLPGAQIIITKQGGDPAGGDVEVSVISPGGVGSIIINPGEGF